MARLLILPSPFRFTNPTWETLIDHLVTHCAAHVIGPAVGRPSHDIAKVIRDQGPFDAVIIDPWFYFQSSTVPEEYRPKNVRGLGVPVILSLMQYDLHNLSKDFIDNAERADAIISVSSGNGFCIEYNYDVFQRESWLSKDSYSISSPDVFSKKFILLPHCVAPREFCSAGTAKGYDLITPGVEYHFRKLVREWCRAHPGVSVRQEKDLFQRILSRLSLFFPFGAKISAFNRPLGVGLYRSRFRKAISEARVGVTCDGSINYPIRKYFEIPACGTLLAARFFERPERLGFRSGENCYALDEDRLDDLLDIIDLARSDAAEARQVRDAGQAMVRELHSVDVRAAQLQDFCRALASGAADTMTWDAGRPVLQRQGPAQ